MPGATVARSARDARSAWIAAFRAVRGETERRAAPLSDEDQAIQSMPDASPTKWHRAHTTWFFEQFLLKPQLPGYEVFDPDFAFLFNSYYVAAGPRHARPQRGLITRPANARVADYRAHVDAAVEQLIADADDASLPEVARILEIGLNHEQQHQELILTDILHAFAQNPLLPAYDAGGRLPKARATLCEFVEIPSGLHSIGFAGDGYAFDNEGPAHQVYLRPVRIARSLVTNGAMARRSSRTAAMRRASLWLSDGWATVQAEGWDAPGYWRKSDGGWQSPDAGRIESRSILTHRSRM